MPPRTAARVGRQPQAATRASNRQPKPNGSGPVTPAGKPLPQEEVSVATSGLLSLLFVVYSANQVYDSRPFFNSIRAAMSMIFGSHHTLFATGAKLFARNLGMRPEPLDFTATLPVNQFAVVPVMLWAVVAGMCMAVAASQKNAIVEKCTRAVGGNNLTAAALHSIVLPSLQGTFAVASLVTVFTFLNEALFAGPPAMCNASRHIMADDADMGSLITYFACFTQQSILPNLAFFNAAVLLYFLTARIVYPGRQGVTLLTFRLKVSAYKAWWTTAFCMYIFMLGVTRVHLALRAAHQVDFNAMLVNVYLPNVVPVFLVGTTIYCPSVLLEWVLRRFQDTPRTTLGQPLSFWSVLLRMMAHVAVSACSVYVSMLLAGKLALVFLPLARNTDAVHLPFQYDAAMVLAQLVVAAMLIMFALHLVRTRCQSVLRANLRPLCVVQPLRMDADLTRGRVLQAMLADVCNQRVIFARITQLFVGRSERSRLRNEVLVGHTRVLLACDFREAGEFRLAPTSFEVVLLRDASDDGVPLLELKTLHTLRLTEDDTRVQADVQVVMYGQGVQVLVDSYNNTKRCVARLQLALPGNNFVPGAIVPLHSFNAFGGPDNADANSTSLASFEEVMNLAPAVRGLCTTMTKLEEKEWMGNHPSVREPLQHVRQRLQAAITDNQHVDYWQFVDALAEVDSVYGIMSSLPTDDPHRKELEDVLRRSVESVVPILLPHMLLNFMGDGDKLSLAQAIFSVYAARRALRQQASERLPAPHDAAAGMRRAVADADLEQQEALAEAMRRHRTAERQANTHAEAVVQAIGRGGAQAPPHLAHSARDPQRDDVWAAAVHQVQAGEDPAPAPATPTPAAAPAQPAAGSGASQPAGSSSATAIASQELEDVEKMLLGSQEDGQDFMEWAPFDVDSVDLSDISPSAPPAHAVEVELHAAGTAAPSGPAAAADDFAAAAFEDDFAATVVLPTAGSQPAVVAGQAVAANPLVNPSHDPFSDDWVNM